jgi:N-acetylneuraminate synthase/N,N'-diacetyllegionaminate synthase
MTTGRIPWDRNDRPLLLAEIGGNHEGSYDAACRLCDLAIASGADYVKFQIYTGDGLVNPRESAARHQHFRRFELSREQHLSLAERCRAAGVGYCASVWEPAALEWIDEYLDFYKIGSGDLTAWPLIARFAERGKPMLLSTGLSTLQEVVDTVAFIRDLNRSYETAGRLVLLQCTAMYPIEDEDANLRAMDTMRAETGLDVGYSDHTRGSLALLVAAARGARVLEFHFTDQREGKVFRDHAVSLTCDEVRLLESQLLRMAIMMGDGVKRPMPCEVESGHLESFRRAVYCPLPLKAGDSIRAQDLVSLRPNHGVDARRFRDIDGQIVRKDLEPFEPLSFE